MACVTDYTPNYRDIRISYFRVPRIAVFVDGCFWHGYPINGTMSKQNREFWNSKIERNIERDAEINETLSGLGWRIVHVWEREIKEDFVHTGDGIE